MNYCIVKITMSILLSFVDSSQSMCMNFNLKLCVFVLAEDIGEALDDAFPEDLMTVRPGIVFYHHQRDILCIHCKVCLLCTSC